MTLGVNRPRNPSYVPRSSQFDDATKLMFQRVCQPVTRSWTEIDCHDEDSTGLEHSDQLRDRSLIMWRRDVFDYGYT
jgi:hypothetical protein